MNRKLSAGLAPAVALLLLCCAFRETHAQPAREPFAFRPGQSMYIVAFRFTPHAVTVDGTTGVTVTNPDYFDYVLDVERKVRKEVEQWKYFRVSDRPSEADFIFLVNVDDSAIEGLALPFDAYRQHFKEKFDLDSLRDSAYGRYLAGPLNIPTVSRLTDRLVKQFREKVAGGDAGKRPKT